MQNKKPKRYRAAILMAIICLGVAAHFCGKIIYQEMQYKEGDDVYERLAETKVTDSMDDSSDEIESADTEQIDSGTEDPIITVDVATLQEDNPSIKAWLYSPDTVIDYPVCQCGDNTYYLHHLVDGTYNCNGCLFIDCKNSDDFTDDNTIIYGHHMASGKMFASLVKYADQSYYEAHPVMYLKIGGQEYKLEIFSGYVTTVDSSAYTINCGTRQEYTEWLRDVSRRSDFTPNAITLTTDDRIVTLSTCAYNFQNARYVVHARIVSLY